MKRLYSIIAILSLALASTSALASKEGILRLDSFQLTSQGISDSGPVTITGNQGDKGISRLTIKAFGREFDLDDEQLAKIRGLAINGIQLSYETGYKELGGRTLYILLSKGFTSGNVGHKFVVVTESGAIRVGDELR
jgi:hypothetical protein